MNKKLIGISIILMLLIVGLSGCLSSEEQRFIGSWQDDTTEEFIYTFKEEFLSKPLEIKSSSINFVQIGGGNIEEGSWKIEENKLYLTKNVEQPTTLTYYYRFEDDNTLILTTMGIQENVEITLRRI